MFRRLKETDQGISQLTGVVLWPYPFVVGKYGLYETPADSHGCFGVCVDEFCSRHHPCSVHRFGAELDSLEDVSFPPSSRVIDVTKAPYHAKGDGIHDDTAAIQQALDSMMGLHKLLYFPQGTYLVSKTLKWSNKNSEGQNAWGKNYLCGQNVNKTTIRLKDGVFTDPQKPQSIMWCGGFGSADWFHNYVENITFDVGQNNPGATGLQFYSNNSGAVRNCRFVAKGQNGAVGLDLGHRDMNGPLLVRNCAIEGFDRGISTARAVNGQTFEYITLRGQRQVGFDNEGQTISVRGLLSENAIPAVRSYGMFCLVDARLNGVANSSRWPAVINYNGGRVYLRDLDTTNYARAVGDVVTPDWVAATRITGEDKVGSLGPKVREYCSHPASTSFPVMTQSLRMPVKEPPLVPLDPIEKWVNVDDFGADPTGNQDSAQAIQKAMNSGASTVFLPGFYALNSTVTLGPTVRRVVGLGGWVDYQGKAKPDFRVENGDGASITFEHFSYIHGGIHFDTQRTIYLRSVSDCDLTFGPKAIGGEVFLEDVVTHNLKLNKQRVWARQLNVENEGTHVTNNGGQLWLLGYKTERGGTLLESRDGASSEILGGFSYTTTAGKLAPMFVINNASLFTFFNEVCFNNDPFTTLIHETQGNETRYLRRDDGHTAPFSSREKQ